MISRVDGRARRPRRLRVIAAAIVVQVAVPTVALAHGVPSRFGFHMYSGQESGLVLEVFDAQGDALAVDLDDYVASGRLELDWTEVLPEAVCRKTPEAVVVTVRSRSRERSVTCGP